MTTLFDSARPVKPARPFGHGLSTLPDRSLPSTEDQSWAAETSPFADERYDIVGPADPDWDALAAECAALDCLERGLIPPDLADSISRASLVGHPA